MDETTPAVTPAPNSADACGEPHDAALDAVTAPTRRTVIARSAAMAAAGATVGLTTACGSGTSSADTPRTVRSATGATNSNGNTAIAALSTVPVGSAMSTSWGDQPIILTQPTAGTVKAFSAICTHQGCTVALQGDQLICPCHTSVFDLTTGEVISGPAPTALPEVRVTVRDGSIYPA